MILTLIQKLYRVRLLTLAGGWSLLEALMTTGVNLMALLHVAARLHPHRPAVTDERGQLSYARLREQTEALALALRSDYAVGERQKVAIACRNHAAAIKTILAVSRLGGHTFLLNPEMSAEQILALIERLQFDFFVYDEQLAPIVENSSLKNKALPTYHKTGPSIDQLSAAVKPAQTRLNKVKPGNIVVLTGGTTGQPKLAGRKPALFNFLPPFLALLTQMHFDRYQSLYIATPICHGHGLAFLFLGLILGMEMYFTERFEAGRAVSLIAAHQIQAITVVPLMLQRMLKFEAAPLASLECIISGSALLSPALAKQTIQQLGPKLFNLYGSSEAGFCIIGTPDIIGPKPEAVGKPIGGVQARIVDAGGQEVAPGVIGALHIRSAWTAGKSWIETGDLAYQDNAGVFFLCGRADDMIVSGGENVYPIELENVLMRHPAVDAAAVWGIPDEEFGQRLKAVVVKKQDVPLTEAELLAWLKSRVARYQMPAEISFSEELPYTALGKVNKKLLRHQQTMI